MYPFWYILCHDPLSLKNIYILFNITSLSIGKDTCIVAIESILKNILPKALKNILLTWKREKERMF